MGKYKAIFFDMDGTLLPMDMKVFTSGYFKFLAKKLAKYEIPFDKLVAAIWDGTGSMVKNNDPDMRNDVVFWERFNENIPGLPIKEVAKDCNEFYSKEFMEAKIFTEDNPLAVKAVELAHEKAEIVALATNPLFPMDGQRTRMSWVGLKEEDFDLVTAYETDYYCKPNPNYFLSVCERLGVKPEECLMIGNDEEEDMYACSMVGIDGYLVTDTMIPSKEHPWNGAKGTFEDLIKMLSDL